MSEDEILFESSPIRKVLEQEPLKFIPHNDKLASEMNTWRNKYKLWDLYKKEQ